MPQVKPKYPPVTKMTKDELLDEVCELIRSSKVHNFYDRKRFRSVGEALKKKGFKFTP